MPSQSFSTDELSLNTIFRKWSKSIDRWTAAERGRWGIGNMESKDQTLHEEGGHRDSLACASMRGFWRTVVTRPSATSLGCGAHYLLSVKGPSSSANLGYDFEGSTSARGFHCASPLILFSFLLEVKHIGQRTLSQNWSSLDRYIRSLERWIYNFCIIYRVECREKTNYETSSHSSVQGLPELCNNGRAQLTQGFQHLSDYSLNLEKTMGPQRCHLYQETSLKVPQRF